MFYTVDCWTFFNKLFCLLFCRSLRLMISNCRFANLHCRIRTARKCQYFIGLAWFYFMGESNVEKIVDDVKSKHALRLQNTMTVMALV